MQFVGTFIGIVIFLLLSLFVYFYGYETFKDSILLKGFCFLSMIVSFILLISFLFLNVYVENESVCNNYKIEISDMEMDIYESVSSSKQIHTVIFDLDFQNRKNIVLSEFCFDYDNTNSSSKHITLVHENTILNDNQVFLLNNTVGKSCIEFNSSLLKNGLLMGINCVDCSPTNILKLGQDIDSPKIMELESVNTAISYEPQLDFPHTYNLNLYRNCGFLIKNFFNFVLFVLGLMLLILLGVLMIEKAKSFTDEVSKK